MDELCSESSESSCTFDAMTARWFEACETRVAACASSSWRLSSDWSGGSSGCLTYGREIHQSPCSPCGSVGRRCFACYSRDARDAEGRAVDRKHDRARMRTTGQRTTGDQSTDSHPAQVRDATIASGRTVKSSCSSKRAMACTARALPFASNGRTGELLPEQEAGAVALASGAQTVSR